MKRRVRSWSFSWNSDAATSSALAFVGVLHSPDVRQALLENRDAPDPRGRCGTLGHASYLAWAVAAFQDLRLPAEHDGALRIDRACDLVGCARQVGAQASRNYFLHPAVGVQLDAEMQGFNPGHENKKRTLE